MIYDDNFKKMRDEFITENGWTYWLDTTAAAAALAKVIYDFKAWESHKEVEKTPYWDFPRGYVYRWREVRRGVPGPWSYGMDLAEDGDTYYGRCAPPEGEHIWQKTPYLPDAPQLQTGGADWDYLRAVRS
jgi:hypothetical protein